MLERIIDDINRSLDNEAYLAALTIPDICGKAQYPQKGNGYRYKIWYDEHVGVYEQCPCDRCNESEMPYLSGKVIYSLRNSMLHEGAPNVDSKIIDEFVLVIEKKKPVEIYSDSASIKTNNWNNVVVRKYRLNVRRFCQILVANAKGYYIENKEKFNFFNYTILDWDAEFRNVR